MSDNCHMKIICRKADVPRFEAIGFQVTDSRWEHTVEMEDPAANYGNHDELPADIPYYGWHGEGADYGAEAVACDGKRFIEVEIGHNTTTGFVVEWNEKRNAPCASALREIRRYISIRKRAEKLQCKNISS